MRSPASTPHTSRSRESLRGKYRPRRITLLFIGEAPPASGRFFYRADSGLYRAIRDCFLKAFPSLNAASFLTAFREMGCYLVDLCVESVDRLPTVQRRSHCQAGEQRIAKTLRTLRPQIVISLVKSIAPNVRRAAHRANWTGQIIEVPYPGRWHRHRTEFIRVLAPKLRELFSPT